jgi:hypothetical protein
MTPPIWEQDASTTKKRDSLRPLQETSFEKAQRSTNFVVFSTTWLPQESQLTRITLRPEQAPGRPVDIDPSQYGLTPWSEANPSSLRAVISGRDRRLRIKQFLYDWGVPAASTAPLWNSAYLRPFLCQDSIGWLGTDYMGKPGACTQLMRTQIEISVDEGHFTDLELKNILNGLKVVNEEFSETLQRVPFHRLNYFVRHKVSGPDVPHGLWKYRHARRYRHSQIVPKDELIASSQVPVPVLEHPDFLFDSAVVMNEPDEGHREVEVIYRHRLNHSDYLWMVAMNKDSRIALPEIPEPEDHPAEERREETLRGRTVFYAALTEKFGAWEVFWRERDAAIAVWASASQFYDGQDFRSLVDRVRLV